MSPPMFSTTQAKQSHRYSNQGLPYLGATKV